MLRMWRRQPWLVLLTAIIGQRVLLVSADDDIQTCSGGVQGTCDCLLSCKIFGGDSSQCSQDDPLAAVNASMQRWHKQTTKQCDAMKCIVDCAKQQQCFQPSLQERCADVKKAEEECDVECSWCMRQRGLTALVLSFVVAIFGAR
mmetsp:Transcript_40648/g.73454  ORF Transcript_40648/g.73454 Transcript_40648/m.73454 type:complete len:145 (+) Transcript_40648:59-493(+)